jgi:predicted RNA-binding Zn ribbon-like protein
VRFSDDTEDALVFVVALANTVPAGSASGADELTDPARLTALLDEHGYSGRRDGDDAELADVRATRDRLRALWSLDENGIVTEVNAMLAEADALPQLTRHDALDWHIHATSLDAPLAERIRVEAAMAFVDVVRGGATPLLRVCGADDCEGVFLDQSKNGSRRFCSVRCGNRMNVNAYRERRRG